jgi:EEF1A lysine methyltransferase 4
VLKGDGVFLYITYRQPHFVRPILNRNNEWDLEMEVLGGEGSFEYFGFVLRKGKKAESS